MKLADRFLKHLTDSSFVPPGARIIVACSGGIDSMALLHLLLSARESFPLTLIVAHLDHGLREESAGDARWLCDYVERLGLPCVSGQVDVPGLAQQQKESIELAARNARYRFLQQVCADHQADLIALGHHASDQAETILHRLIRGGGTAGLVGMAEQRGNCIRPLLAFARKDLEGWLQEKRIPWREDSSNRSLDYTRNRLRHRVLPLLQQENPAIIEGLCRLGEQMRWDEEYWSPVVDQWLARHAMLLPGHAELDLVQLSQEPRALRMRLYRAVHRGGRGMVGVELTMVHLMAIDSLLEDGAPQREASIPDSWVARRYDSLIVRHTPPVVFPYREEISGTGLWSMGGMFNIEVSSCVSIPEVHDPYEWFCTKEDLQKGLLARTFRAGDRIALAGGGRKKVKSIFGEARLRHEERRIWPLLFGNNELLWIPGFKAAPYPEQPQGGELVRIRLIGGKEGIRTPLYGIRE